MTMCDFIKRADATEAVWRILNGMGILQKHNDRLVEEVDAVLDEYPAADVRPVVRGRWIDRDDKYYGWNMWACSACGEEFVLTEGTPDMNEYHFCPNCGAMMEES